MTFLLLFMFCFFSQKVVYKKILLIFALWSDFWLQNKCLIIKMNAL